MGPKGCAVPGTACATGCCRWRLPREGHHDRWGRACSGAMGPCEGPAPPRSVGCCAASRPPLRTGGGGTKVPRSRWRCSEGPRAALARPVPPAQIHTGPCRRTGGQGPPQRPSRVPVWGCPRTRRGATPPCTAALRRRPPRGPTRWPALTGRLAGAPGGSRSHVSPPQDHTSILPHVSLPDALVEPQHQNRPRGYSASPLFSATRARNIHAASPGAPCWGRAHRAPQDRAGGPASQTRCGGSAASLLGCWPVFRTCRGNGSIFTGGGGTEERCEAGASSRKLG